MGKQFFTRTKEKPKNVWVSLHFQLLTKFKEDIPTKRRLQKQGNTCFSTDLRGNRQKMFGFLFHFQLLTKFKEDSPLWRRLQKQGNTCF